MPLSVCDELGRYEILAPIGAGHGRIKIECFTGAWTLLHPETRLSAQDVETICAAARRAQANAAVGR